ncbi:MAG: DUF1365 family protein [Pseudomonadota bacterium]
MLSRLAVPADRRRVTGSACGRPARACRSRSANFIDDAEILLASHSGRREALTDATILRNVIRHPLMTVKVVAGIHWEALFLWLKRARFHRRPEPPASDVSFIPARTTNLSDAA